MIVCRSKLGERSRFMYQKGRSGNDDLDTPEHVETDLSQINKITRYPDGVYYIPLVSDSLDFWKARGIVTPNCIYSKVQDSSVKS